MNTSANTPRRLQLFLSTLCLLLLLVLTVEMDQDHNFTIEIETREQITPTSTSATSNVAINAATPLEAYNQIIDRPLFMQDRRPYVPEKMIQAPQRNRREKPTRKAAQDEYLLSAVIITDNKRIALLQTKKNKKLQKLNEGDVLEGWTVIDIQPERVSLEKGSLVKQLALAVKGSPRKTETSRNKDNEQQDLIEITPPSAKDEKSDPQTQIPTKTKVSPENKAI